jgi:predicted metal-dependent HD superfamily phosphohydrolase
MQHIEQNWFEILEPYQVELEPARKLFEELTCAYSEPGRHYHTLTHIRHVLQVVDSLSHKLEDSAPVRLAAWYHDVIYDSQARDNEEKSAELAEQHLKALNLPAKVVAETSRLVLMTKQHAAPPEDINAQVLLDADLAILGASPEQYRAYSQAIRQEYAWVENEAYRLGRTRVLESFSQRPRIYGTTELFASLEQPARQNIASEIAILSRDKDK